MKSKCIWLLVNDAISREEVFTGVSANGGDYRPAKFQPKILKNLTDEPSSQYRGVREYKRGERKALRRDEIKVEFLFVYY